VAAIRDWLANDKRPANLYDLLGKPWFDPDRAELFEAIRTAYAELLPYQNHQDRKVAERAVQLQKELGRAESVLSDPKRLMSHHQEMVGHLRRVFETASEEADQYWDSAQVERWLVEQQGVHGEAATSVGRALTSPGKTVLDVVPSGKWKEDASRIAREPADMTKTKPPRPRRLMDAFGTEVEIFGVNMSAGVFGFLLLLAGAVTAVCVLAPWRRDEEQIAGKPSIRSPPAPRAVTVLKKTTRPGLPSAPAGSDQQNASKRSGETRTFEGRLAEIRGHAGEIHLLIVDVAALPNRMLEAFTRDYSFAREIGDYRTDEDKTTPPRGDAVVVEVAVPDAGPSAAGFRLCSWWGAAAVALAELRSIARKDDSGSRAVVGSRRPDGSFAEDRKLSNLAALMRIHPPEGTPVRSVGILEAEKSDPLRITLRPWEPMSDTRMESRRPDGTREVHTTCTAVRLVFPPGTADAARLRQAKVVSVEAVAHSGGGAERLEMTVVRWECLLSDDQLRGWQEVCSRPTSCIGQEVELAGILDGRSDRGAQGTLRVRPYVQTGSKAEPVEIPYSTSGVGASGLASFERGTEILCKVRVVGGERPQLALVWAATALDPQNKLPFAEPAAGAPPTVTQQ